MIDLFPSSAVAFVIRELQSLCVTAADQHSINVISAHAEEIWRAIAKRKRTDGGLPAQERVFQFPALVDGRRPIGSLTEIKRKEGKIVISEFVGDPRAVYCSTDDQFQALQFSLLLRNLFRVYRDFLDETPAPQLSAARLSDNCKRINEMLKFINPEARYAAGLADFYNAAGASKLAALQGAEADELAREVAGLEQVFGFISKRAQRAENHRNRTEPDVKLLQKSIAKAFELSFGTPQHALAASLTSALLGKPTNRDVTRWLADKRVS